MVAIRSSANPYRVYREKNSRVVNLWSHGIGLRQRLGGGWRRRSEQRVTGNESRANREQRTENGERERERERGTGLDDWVLEIGGSGGAGGGGGWRRVQVHIGEGVAEQCARSMRSRYDYRKPSHNYFLYVENVPSPLVSFLPPFSLRPCFSPPLKPPVSSLRCSFCCPLSARLPFSRRCP